MSATMQDGFVEEYLMYAYTCARNAARPGDDPDDITSAAHDGLLNAAKRADRSFPVQQLKRFISLCVAQALVTITRKQARRRRMAEVYSLDRVYHLPARERHLPLEVLAHQLSGPHREIAIAVYYEQKTVAQFCEETGTPSWEATRLLRTARKLMLAICDDPIGDFCDA